MKRFIIIICLCIIIITCYYLFFPQTVCVTECTNYVCGEHDYDDTIMLIDCGSRCHTTNNYEAFEDVFK